MSKCYSILICITDGIEEIETVSSIDILNRSNMNVTVVSTTNNYHVSCAHGTNLTCDILLKDLKNNDDCIAMVIPGGLQAAKHFQSNNLLLKYIYKFKDDQKIIGAICATPAITIASNNIFPEAKMTGYLEFKNLIPSKQWSENPICWDNKYKLLTAQSVKYSIDFNLKLISIILGENISKKIAAQL
ncbi:hypothetical protein GJT81_00250 [Enterobacteriaceae endosymbiont of Plateumaris consimilis]|uniref:DJ-1 family glyoxalase III n=1 Tax=Enterobacteriaceae endosymbiont of Plateumaris consimilis TaxID=2675794 RepID=UPI00144A1FAE|nr:DJ-1 family glyoxalase III [Enterobacteriaceae endosymbiont of Plateumaris consimilis]QJC28466.1 hypothetical protein GJT81_00250 [Enterobacteriaceae endosymbiont of Plateumaris consimilis]